MRRLRPALAGVVVAAALAGVHPPPAAAALPAGFDDELVAFVGAPTALAFTGDGRLLITAQGGTVRVVRYGSLLAAPALDLSGVACTNGERGLLGIAVDPSFASNGRVFVYYTFRTTGACDQTAVNRVSRFVMTGDTLGSEVVLVDNIPSPTGFHNAGDLQFGRDGLLYVSVGDGAAGSAARDEHVLAGKILRITPDGAIPAGNPFQGPGTARCNLTGRTAPGMRCQETFAWGLRNPFRMAFDPDAAGTLFYVNDVGQATWEEINLGAAGADYGWNVREGHCAAGSTTNCGPPPAGMTNPIFDYGHSSGCDAITGGAFVPNGVWPAAFQGRYLFADYGCGAIFRLDPAGGGTFTRVDFATGLGANSAVHLAFGPWNGTQVLYYTSYAAGGQVRRIVHPASAPNSEVAGFTWYSTGASTLSGPSGTAVRAYGTGLVRDTAYRLVSSPAEADPRRGCIRDLVPLNGALRFANNRGFVGLTTGSINRPPGDWDVCFKEVDGTAVGLPVRFRVI